jgi:CheY-like chemotaxis protein
MYKILIIDDDPLILHSTKILLEIATDWTILLAASGREGLVLAVNEQPDAILLDVRMPSMDGIETLERLRKNPATRSIPVIFFTSLTQVSELENPAQLTVLGIISKPFETNDFVDKIRFLLGWT